MKAILNRRNFIVSRLQHVAIIAFLFVLFSQQNGFAQACSGITFSFEHYEPCKFRAKYSSMNDCFTEIRYTLESGSFASWSVNDAAGFTADEISPSEIWIHHNAGFLPVGDQTPLLFTLAPDVNTNMLVAYLDDCAQIGCEIFGGIPIESCPDPQDASIVGVKYRECNSLPYSNQQTIPDWTIQLLDEMGNVLGEQVTDADGAYAFYDLHAGNYIIREGQLPGWTTKVPASGEYSVNLAASEQAERNFGNCPGCSCDSIIMETFQEAGNVDTSTYYLSLSVLDAFCFKQITIQIDTGNIIDWTIDLPGWIIERVGNILLVTPPAVLGVKVCRPCHYRLAGAGNHAITLGTTYDVGMGLELCSKTEVFQNPPINYNNNCCPSGQTQGPELVVNGNFDTTSPPPAPGSGFSTDYIWSSTGKGAGHFSILNGAQVGSVNFPFWACVGKSGNPNTDYFMVVDGSSDITDIVWRESVSVLPSTEYSFSIWVNNIDRPIYNTTDPLIQIQITDPNGGIVAVSPPTSVPETPDEWVNICLHWIAPSNPSSFYRLEILTLAGIIGNDFALDCLSFKACMPPDPCSVSISVTPNPNKCGEVQVCAVSQNPAPVTFQWCDGRTDSCFTADQLPCDSVTYCVTITCSDGSTATAEVVYVVQDIVPPVINCPQDTTILGSLAPNGLCTAIYIPPGINATDNCDPNVVVTSIVPTVFSEGANTIVVTAMDRCGNVSTCSYEVTVYCDSCTCGTFSDLFIRPSAGPSIPVYCDSLPVTIICPPNGQPLPLTGIFNCVGNCPDSTTVDYMLIQPDGNMISMTGVTASPNFAINVPQGMLDQAGVYCLKLTGYCNGQPCPPCLVKFQLEMPCDTCQCGSVQWAEFYREWDFKKVITCGSDNIPPLQVPCLAPGQNYFIHGDFTCQSSDCANNDFSWTLNRPFPLSPVTGTASSWLNVHFDISLSNAYFTVPGNYTLTVTRYCGINPCSCTFKFEVLPCDCDCSHLGAQAYKGFSVSGSVFNCDRKFKPISNLCSNDEVRWHVNGPNVGTTTGSASFSYTFPSSGKYWVCMVVVRQDPVNGLCYYKRCRWVTVRCSPFDDPTVCKNSVLKNGNFSEGVVAGHLGYSGAINDWSLFPNSGLGTVYVDTTGGSSDDGYLVFDGGLDNFGAVYQTVDLSQDNFINLEYHYYNLLGDEAPDGTVLEFRLHADSLPGSPNEVLYTHMISMDTSEAGWQRRFISLPLSNFNPDYKYLVICVRNKDATTRSLIGLDNLTICTSTSMLLGTNEATDAKSLQLFPNPTTGTLNIDLPEVAKQGMNIRVVNLAGQIVMERNAVSGNSRQTLVIGDLPGGLYFLQIVLDGRVMSVEKFVKQ